MQMMRTTGQTELVRETASAAKRGNAQPDGALQAAPPPLAARNPDQHVGESSAGQAGQAPGQQRQAGHDFRMQVVHVELLVQVFGQKGDVEEAN